MGGNSEPMVRAPSEPLQPLPPTAPNQPKGKPMGVLAQRAKQAMTVGLTGALPPAPDMAASGQNTTKSPLG